MADRAFDRYGRILGSTGYDYVIQSLESGKQPEQIIDQIEKLHPQFSRSEIGQFVSEGIQAKSATDALNTFLNERLSSAGIQPSDEARAAIDWHDFVVTNPKLFGVAPEGDRFHSTFEFGETTGLPLIKVTVTFSEFPEYFDAYRAAYERAVEICGMYPTKFGLENPNDCNFIFSRAYAPEKRW